MNLQSRHTAILILFLGIVSFGCNQKKQLNDVPEKPNIVFYLADDQDKLDYGCYGNEKIHTPAVDQLAKEGLLFENAFTGQAICAPSRSQLYTGNYPLKNGCFLNHVPTRDKQKSIIKYMRELGYEVILAGKSHVRPNHVYDWDLEFKTVRKDGVPRLYLPLGKIRSYFEKADKPFCMFITSEFPHPPYYNVEGSKPEDIKLYPFNEQNKKKPKAIKKHAGYYRNVKEDNTQLEKVLSWVEEYLDKNTLFIYSADHGASGKWTLYDRGVNVPFIARWPGVIEPNTRTNKMIHYTDILPTFVEIAGGKAVEEVDGKSILPVFLGENVEMHEYVYGVQTNQNVLKAAVFPSRMVRSKKFKYIKNFNSIEVVENNLGENEFVNQFIKMGAEKFKNHPFEELYDIQNDPFELNNLAKDPQYLNIKEELATELKRWMKEQGDFLVKENYMPILEHTGNRLDETTRHKTIPKELENSLKEEDYYDLHF